MKKFLDTLRNIWSIEDLRSRILTTLSLLFIYRLGSFVVLPGIDAEILQQSAGDAQGFAQLINIFSGGSFSRASIFALGIMPYISASIVMQLAGIAVPRIQKMQREGESGRKKITQWTRYLTIIVTLLQGSTYIGTQIPAEAIVTASPLLFKITSIIVLVTGTLFVMWLGERITEKGIGNGTSLIIMIGIIASFPTALAAEFETRLNGAGGAVFFLLEIIFLLLVILVSILLVQGTRRVPVQYAKRIVGKMQTSGGRNFLPLKVNASGVMPIIFASTIMVIPPMLFSTNGTIISMFSNPFGFGYNLTLGILIVAFTYFYTAIIMSPQQMAEEMKKNGGFIPGVKPGKRTADFIDTVLSRITLPGSIFLALVAVFPAFAYLLGVSPSFALFFGGTSLLIMVGVVLDTLQQIESHLLMKRYDGLMKGTKIKGRSSLPVMG